VALSLDQARSVYDRIGRVQDWQAFYEDATTERLVANAALYADQTIFEFGCGRLCLASLTHGDRLLERAISRTWTGLWRVAPQLVGGCRPITVSALLGHGWRVEHQSRVHRWGLVTDVVIATPSTRQQ